MSEPTGVEALSGGKAVLKMRDEFLQLVHCYNRLGHYKNAMKAQAMAIALNDFEDQVAITEIAWPPETCESDGEVWMKEIADHD